MYNCLYICILSSTHSHSGSSNQRKKKLAELCPAWSGVRARNRTPFAHKNDNERALISVGHRAQTPLSIQLRVDWQQKDRFCIRSSCTMLKPDLKSTGACMGVRGCINT